MKLACCLVACDLNPAYLDCFPLVHRLWRELVGVDVRLVLIAERIPESLASLSDSIAVFEPLPSMHTAFQAQCIRLLYPALLSDDYRDAVLTSDIDMLPMSRRYFVDPLAPLRPDGFVIYRSGVLDHLGELPICYNAAAPDTWAELFGGVRDGKDVRSLLQAWWAELDGYEGYRSGANWNADQKKLFGHVAAWGAGAGRERVARLTDRATGFRRVERHKPQRFSHALARRARLISCGYFSDFHMMQPPGEHAALNEAAAAAVMTRPTRIDRICAAVETWLVK